MAPAAAVLLLAPLCSTLSTWSYGRVTVWNASHLTYEHVFNANGSVFDSWTIAQSRHGPFPG